MNPSPLATSFRFVTACLIVGAFAGCVPQACTSCQAVTQPFAPTEPDFANSFAVETRYNKAEQALTVLLRLQPGYHAYAPGEKVGVPLAVVMQSQGGWRVRQPPRIPPGQKKDLGELGISLVLTGDVQVVVRLEKLKADAGPIEGVLKVHVCTNGACGFPQEHPFVVHVP